MSARLAAACFVATLPFPLLAQRATTVGVRGGGGVDVSGSTVYGAQIELTEHVGSGSVQLALAGVGGPHLIEDYEREHGQNFFPYHEETRVWGVALTASYLFRHSRDTGGPYFMMGIGLGPQWVDWRIETTYNRFGNPLPGGGGFDEDEGVTLGTVINLGVGQRLHDHFDLRAQVLTLLVPSSTEREDVKLIPTFTLTTGLGF